MAPRSAKTKKAADGKVSENEVPKKGRGRKKVTEEPLAAAEIKELEVIKKETSVAAEKKKRGKKISNDINGQDQTRKNQNKIINIKDEIESDLKDEVPEPPAKKQRVLRKDNKGASKKETVDEVVPEIKAVRSRRGQKKDPESVVEVEVNPLDIGEQVTKRRRKQVEEKAEETKKKAPTKNKTVTNYEELNFSNSSKSEQGKEWNFKIASWNVDGIRAWMSKGGLDYIQYEKPDILCLQEVKCAQNKLPQEIVNLPGYHAYWLCSEKDGYAGVGIYTTKLAMNVQNGLQNEELDNEGRIITAEYEKFYLICVYVPNAGRKLVTLPRRLKWNEEFRKYVKDLDKKKPVIICGDMNVAHNEIDLANPKTNRKNAGFTDEERKGMTDLLGDGFVDTYRHINPDKTGAYTFWTYMMNSRAKNVGWRLDYFIVSERLLPSVCDSVIRDEVYGSDHCPISLFLHLSCATKPTE